MVDPPAIDTTPPPVVPDAPQTPDVKPDPASEEETLNISPASPEEAPTTHYYYANITDKGYLVTQVTTIYAYPKIIDSRKKSDALKVLGQVYKEPELAIPKGATLFKEITINAIVTTSFMITQSGDMQSGLCQTKKNAEMIYSHEDWYTWQSHTGMEVSSRSSVGLYHPSVSPKLRSMVLAIQAMVRLLSKDGAQGAVRTLSNAHDNFIPGFVLSLLPGGTLVMKGLGLTITIYDGYYKYNETISLDPSKSMFKIFKNRTKLTNRYNNYL